MDLKEYSQRKKNIRKVYQEAFGLVPELKEEEIKLVFERGSDYPGMFSIAFPFNIPTNLYINIDETPNLPIEWQKAGIIHELGHFKRSRKYSKTELQILYRRVIELKGYEFQGYLEPDIFFNLDKSIQHRIKRLKQHSLLHEIYADQEVINAGLGQPYLERTRWAYENQDLSELGKEENKVRIKNLEQKLGEQK